MSAVRTYQGLAAGWLGAVGAMLLGCEGGPPRVAAPGWSPPSIAARAIDQLDTDGDRQIDAAEAAPAPSLVEAFERIDANHDQRLSEDEIRQRFELYVKLGTGLASQSFQVLVDGRPLPYARVDFVPEEFLGGVIEPATGTTDHEGVVVPQAEGQDLPAMRVGFYHVEVYPEGDSAAGPLPVRSSVGIEVSPVSEPDQAGTPVLSLET